MIALSGTALRPRPVRTSLYTPFPRINARVELGAAKGRQVRPRTESERVQQLGDGKPRINTG